MKSIVSKTAILFFFVLLFSSCRLFFDMDCINGDKNNYEFYLPFTLYPAQDTFHINDTIWLHADFSDELLDSNSLNYYKVENQTFRSSLFFERIDTSPRLDANPDFLLLNDTGYISFVQFPTASSFDIAYLYVNSRYKLHAGFVPGKTGLYAFNLGAVTYQEVDFQKRCPGELMNVLFNLNSGAENNYPFMALSPDTLINSYPYNKFTYNGYYCFYVVE
ncbi:MAG: hypothetical protein IPM47_00800 [Sphingobacteriales bacterium]|nr:MAG: hypothetical protein IPM47_00800 [Sphingobacteriales bacterium]